MNISELINDAIEYILLHIYENVTAAKVAEHCHVSRFYFTRVFKQQTGESVYAFIKKKKLEFSAFMLKSESSRSITDIAGEYGYSSSNYSSAFRNYFGQSPVEFRHERFGSHNELLNLENKNIRMVYDEINSIVSIKEMPQYRIVYERRIGNYNEMKDSWSDFCERYDRFSTDKTLFFERTFDDPSIADSDKCLYDICMSDEGIGTAIEKCGDIAKLELPESAVFGTINGGKFALCPFKGYLSEISQFHRKLIDIWLPLSGYSLDSRYSYDLYHRVDGNTYYMEFDICIPVK